MNELERRRRRLAWARTLIRLQLAIAIAAPVIAAFYFLAAPGGPRPMFWRPSLLESVLPWAAVMGFVIGIVWTVRLSRPDPEASDGPWRYRDF